MTDPVVESVVNKYTERSLVGQKKYNTTLHQNNHDNYLKHLQEELMDASLYIEKLLHLGQEITRMVNLYEDDAHLGEAIRKMIR
jgi:hypothetical protein